MRELHEGQVIPQVEISANFPGSSMHLMFSSWAAQVLEDTIA
jgi:hypothetical protein